ncbi:MAG TPA: heterodisulfide reductase-related iron-sulfur binding cluster [Gaiellaceae bacterium]|nr:heterodisulfide reductase-related iron-sulfur binding cluster [Gaiellaceae bacterium]
MTPILLGAGETRETFAGLETWQIVLWYVLIAVSVAIFAFGVARLLLKYRRGRTRSPLERPLDRALRAARIVATHAWIRRRDPLAGLAHLLVFYGFVVLFIGTAILAFQDDFADPVLGFHFWEGWFYLGYSLFLDVFGAALVVGLSLFAVKRGILKPFRLSYWRPVEPAPPLRDMPRWYRRGDWAFLGSLFFLALTGFLLEAFRIAADDPDFEVWAPFGWLAGQAFIAVGFEGDAAEAARATNWWVHGVVALFWVSAIPFTKAVHMLAGPAGVAAKDERAGRRLAPLPADAKAEDVGYATIDALAPKHLLDLDACTKCGKCHAACPATASLYPLSPRDLVLDLREVAEGALGNRAALGIPPRFPEPADLLGTIKPETLWSCMQCMACVEICPVGIEHVPIINQMRRALVERGEMDGQLQQTLETVYTSGNSFGEAKRKRGRWTRELDFAVPDARKEPVDLLWFVGDYASFDPRNQKATQALARVLHGAGVRFGILYDAERTAGNDVRRVGEEGLWTSLAEENLETLAACRFERILTSDPHTFNTLRNEYPQLGGSWPVVHHTQLLAELLASGRLARRKGLGYRVTYHDPCTLGRMNGVYDEPRDVVGALGCELVEMPRNRDNSFCCGAGGGRIWMQELRPEGAQRPSESRIDEAVALGGIDYFVVACPKDVTMYEDAIKTSGHQGEIELRELSELVLEALGSDGSAAAAPRRAVTP